MKLIYIFIITLMCAPIFGQLIPNEEENIPFLVTFGSEAKKSYGDDDYSQVFFFKVPKDYDKPFYIRIFDPEVGGKNDEIIGVANTKIKYKLYGGTGAYTHPDSKSINPQGEYKKGNLIFVKSFTTDSEFDNRWYTVGPINPSEGELVQELDARIFKFIAEGDKGDDGNLYRYFLSSNKDKNVEVEGGNAFTYEYSIRLPSNQNEISHIYPYIDSKVVSIKQHNFDWDSDGTIVIYSISKVGEKAKTSHEADWEHSLHTVVDTERGSCMDFQLIKNKITPYENNNVVFYVTNQYGELLPFYSVPIGVFKPSNRKIKVE